MSLLYVILYHLYRPLRYLRWYTSLGARGERIAATYLQNKGYHLITTNWRSSRCKGEIDILARYGQQLVAIEVKTKNILSYNHHMALDNVSKEKWSILHHIFLMYLITMRGKLWKLRLTACRVDLITIDITPAGIPCIQHYEGIVPPPYLPWR